jgi:hypothetical protein
MTLFTLAAVVEQQFGVITLKHGDGPLLSGMCVIQETCLFLVP